MSPLAITLFSCQQFQLKPQPYNNPLYCWGLNECLKWIVYWITSPFHRDNMHFDIQQLANHHTYKQTELCSARTLSHFNCIFRCAVILFTNPHTHTCTRMHLAFVWGAPQVFAYALKVLFECKWKSGNKINK